MKKAVLVPTTLYLSAFYLLSVLNVEKKFYTITAIFLFFVLLQNIFKVQLLYLNFSLYFNVVIFLFFILISQNYLLNIETISWDISSYLVASQDIQRGFLPLEKSYESKGPVFFYIINFILVIVKNNYLYFKLANDFIILIISLILYLTIRFETKNLSQPLILSLVYLNLMSLKWYISEFSELYNLFFIALAIFIHRYKIESNLNIFFAGFILSLGILINQGSVLFTIPFFISILYSNKMKHKKLLYFFLGGVIPQIFFLTIYYYNNLIDIYLFNYIELPINYSGESLSNFREIVVWLRGVAEYNLFIYLVVVLIVLGFFIQYIKAFKFDKKFLNNFYFNNFVISLLFYFIAGHNYYHHLIYLIYFLPFLVLFIESKNILNLIFVGTLFASILNFNLNYSSSYDNLRNPQETYSNYPLKQLANSISESSKITDFNILALDFHLVLFYLEKPNYAYIIHPTNHFDKTITDGLKKLDLISEDNIDLLLQEKPDVIICNTMMIFSGIPTRLDSVEIEDIENKNWYDCNFENYSNHYYQLNTDKFRYNENLNLNIDPYKEMKVFIIDEK